jgi:hypothetical protein
MNTNKGRKERIDIKKRGGIPLLFIIFLYIFSFYYFLYIFSFIFYYNLRQTLEQRYIV